MMSPLDMIGIPKWEQYWANLILLEGTEFQTSESQEDR